MAYLLDTNTCIAILKDHPNVYPRFATQSAPSFVCAPVKAEMFYGARRSQRVAQNLESFRYFFSRLQSLDFDDAAAEEYGLIRATLEREGTPIGSNDYLIAAIARAHDLTLVTNNTREFIRIPALKLENWHE